jgi:hypothetical protein
VTGGMREVVISDEGGALDAITAHGLPVANAKKMLAPFCKAAGLKTDGGKIFSPPVPLDAVAGVVALVANASAQAAHHAIDNIKIRRRRDLRLAISDVLQSRFAISHIKHEYQITGHSNKLYRFDTVVEIGGEKRLIIDAVLPEPTSINARVVSHLDVKHSNDPTLIQRIVYDDEEEWDASNLQLLQMASTLVPFTMMGPSIDRISN